MARCTFLLLSCTMAMCCAVALAGKPLPLGTRPYTCPDGKPPVNCLVEPCSTTMCKEKCAKLVPEGYNLNVSCVDNYCGGCKCDCCLAQNNICAVDGPLKHIKCCAGTICAFSNSCIQRPFAKCGTVCIPPEESVNKCKKISARCDPDKIQCCFGTSCRAWKGSKHTFKCQKCKSMGAKCSMTKQDCCPYLSCQMDLKTNKATCQPKQSRL